MKPFAALLLLAIPAVAQPQRPAFLQRIDNAPGWYAVDGRIAPLVGATADPALLNWPDQRVRDFLDTIARSAGNLVLVTPPAAPPAAEPTEADPWLRFQRLLDWTAQRRIAVALQTRESGEPVLARTRALTTGLAHVLPPDSSPERVSGVELFWRSILNGAPQVAFDSWTFEARNSVRAARMIGSFTPLHEYKPNDALLLDRTSAPAFAAARGEDSYLVYLPKGGTISLAAADVPHAIVWICLDTAELEGHARPTSGGIIPLAAPDSRHWLALVSK